MNVIANKINWTFNFVKGRTFDPFTNVYAFDKGLSPLSIEHMAYMFHKSTTTKYFSSYFHPRKYF